MELHPNQYARRQVRVRVLSGAPGWGVAAGFRSTHSQPGKSRKHGAKAGRRKGGGRGGRH